MSDSEYERETEDCGHPRARVMAYECPECIASLRADVALLLAVAQAGEVFVTHESSVGHATTCATQMRCILSDGLTIAVEHPRVQELLREVQG